MRRGGLYAVAGISLALAVVVMTTHGYVGDYLARHAGQRPGADAMVNGALALENILIVALAAAFVACSARMRWLLCVAAIALAIEPVVDVIGFAPDHPMWRLSRMLLVLGHGAFAVAALRCGGARRLGMTQMLIAGTVAVIAMRATANPFTLLVPIDVLTCCIALELLGAFPAAGEGIPAATIRGNARRAATVVGLVLVGCGIAMFAVARELVVELGRNASVDVVLATACAVPGVLMVWRSRGRRVWIPIVIAMVVTITVVFDVASLPYTHADEVPLQTIELPRFAVDLPRGYDRRFVYADVGWIERTPGRANLERVAISWGYREPPVIEEPTFTRRSYVDGIEVKVTSSRTAAFAVIDVVWSCERNRWIDARIMAPEPSWVDLDQLAIRVTDSIRCLDGKPDAPEFAPRLTGEDLQQIGSHYMGKQGERVDFRWTIDRGDYATAIESDPSRAFFWIELGSVDGVDVSRVGVDGVSRVTAESIRAGERRLSQAWRCGPVSVHASYVGSAMSPRFRALEMLADLHCP